MGLKPVPPYFTATTPVSDALLNVLVRLPTASLSTVVTADFYALLDDPRRMRLAVLLASKSYEEGGCPIGAVIIDDTHGHIAGKGHNTLVQEGHPYNHGETSAIRDAGRIDFSTTTLYTSLSPCDVCTALILARGFRRVVVGDITNAAGNEERLRAAGVVVDVIEDPDGVALYRRFRDESPQLDLEDWRGLAAVRQPPD